MAPVVIWLAKFAAYLQNSSVVAVSIATVAAIIAGLALMIRYTRTVGAVLRALGIALLFGGAALTYGKFRLPSVRLPPTWPWIPILGAVLLVTEWFLRRQRIKGVNNRVGSLAADSAEHIDILSQKYRAADFIDLTTVEGRSVIPALRNILRRPRRQSHVFLIGSSGAGKTATLLNFAADCQTFHSTRKRPLISIYVDLAEYARQTSDGTLTEFMQSKFRGLNPSKTWTENGRDVRWVFLFDNADEADLRWYGGQQSWSIVSSFIRQRSRTASFFVVFASRWLPENADPANSITLNGLTDDAWKNFLIQSGLTQSAVGELAKNKSLRRYLKNPGSLKILAPVLARRGWKTGDDVESALNSGDNTYRLMGDAIDRLIQIKPQAPSTELQALRSTATGLMEFLQERKPFYPSIPRGIGASLRQIADSSGSSPREFEDNLTALANCGIIKRTSSQNNVDFVEFSPGTGAYFYADFLLYNHEKIPVRRMLCDQEFRSAAVTLLSVASREIVNQFIQESKLLLDEAINNLSRESPPSDVMPALAKLQKIAYLPYTALSVLVDGRQTQIDVLREELQEKVAQFTELAMPLFTGTARPPAISLTQADLLDLSRTLGAREEAISTLKFGLDSRQPAVVFETGGRMVNAINESNLAELDQAHRQKLIFIVMLIGLRSLSTGRSRIEMPRVLRFADNAGVAMAVLLGVMFVLGGIFQLINFRHFHSANSSYPLPQVSEILSAVALACPIVAARYGIGLRKFVQRYYSAMVMQVIAGSLAIVGAFWLLVVLVSDLATFSASLMPLLASYSLVWPGAVMLHLYIDRHPTVFSVIFPLPQDARTLWNAAIANI